MQKELEAKRSATIKRREELIERNNDLISKLTAPVNETKPAAKKEWDADEFQRIQDKKEQKRLRKQKDQDKKEAQSYHLKLSDMDLLGSGSGRNSPDVKPSVNTH